MRNRIKSLILLFAFGIINQNSLAISSDAQKKLQKLFKVNVNSDESISEAIKSAQADLDKLKESLKIYETELEKYNDETDFVEKIGKALVEYVKKCTTNLLLAESSTPVKEDLLVSTKGFLTKAKKTDLVNEIQKKIESLKKETYNTDGNSPDIIKMKENPESMSWLKFGCAPFSFIANGAKATISYIFDTKGGLGFGGIVDDDKGETTISLTIPGTDNVKNIATIPYSIVKSIAFDYTTKPIAKLVKLAGYDYTTKPFATLAYNHKKKVIAIIMIIIAAEIADQTLNNGEITTATYNYLTQGLGWTKEQVNKLVEYVKEQAILKQSDINNYPNNQNNTEDTTNLQSLAPGNSGNETALDPVSQQNGTHFTEIQQQTNNTSWWNVTCRFIGLHALGKC